MKILAALIAAGAAVPLAAVAQATPECSDIAPNTRMCANPGHTAITSSPNPAYTNPYPGWGFGTLGIPAIGLGGGGFWVGI